MNWHPDFSGCFLFWGGAGGSYLIYWKKPLIPLEHDQKSERNMEKFKQLLFSENGIKIVNMLFFLAFLATTLCFWLWHTWSGSFFWRSASKKVASRTSRIIYGCFIAFAVVMVVLNVVPVLLGYNSAGVRLFAAQTV